MVLKTNLCGTIFPNSVNFDQFGENQCLRNFPFKAHFRAKFPVKFGKSLWRVFAFLCKIFPKTVVLIQITFMFSSKVSFIVIWCRTSENFEWNLLLQFPKYC